MCMVLLTGLCMNAQLVGNPVLTYNIDEITTTGYKITFTPNGDVGGYAACQFDEGTAEQQYNMFGAWMGFTSMGDMVKAWGYNATEESQMVWTGDTPGKNYEVYVQCWDVNGTYADMIIIPITTASLGGDGLAEITIEIGEFGGDSETGYYQWVTFTPNDQVNIFHDMLLEKSAYESAEWGEEKVIEYLTQDMPNTVGWDRNGVDSDRWTVEPGKEYFAFAMGKNAKNEWGPLASIEFSTPGTSGISDMTMGKPMFKRDATQVTICGMKQGGEVSLYDMSGRLVCKTTVGAKGEASIATGNLNNGVYIISDGKTSFKFVK